MTLICASCNGRQPEGNTTRCYYCAGRRLVETRPVSPEPTLAVIPHQVTPEQSTRVNLLLKMMAAGDAPEARDEAGECRYCEADTWLVGHSNGCDYVTAMRLFAMGQNSYLTGVDK
jgi:DNA-directed RNA polymerase subunit RPC12/RpoP